MTLFIGTVYCLRFTTRVLKGIAGLLNKQKLKGLCSSHQLAEPQQIPEPHRMKKKRERGGGKELDLYGGVALKKKPYILGFPCLAGPPLNVCLMLTDLVLRLSSNVKLCSLSLNGL